MDYTITHRAFLAPALLLASTLANADVLSIKIENDTFIGEDGQYTGGLEVAYAFAPPADHWTDGLASLLPDGKRQADNVAYRLGYMIYTPENIERSSLIVDDRPYAGLLSGGVSLFSEIAAEGARVTRGVHLDVGLVGPATGAETIQSQLHEWTDSDEPEGWDNQLENEPFINLGVQQRWWAQHRLGGLEFEHGPMLGGAVGNLYTYAATGFGMRLGSNLDRSFTIPAVTPAHSSSLFFTEGGGFSWYGFANLEGRYMVHNMLLDGNTFSDSHSVDRRPWVGDANLGLALTWSRWQLSFVSVWRTKEFEEQDGSDQFGSLTVSTAF